MLFFSCFVLGDSGNVVDPTALPNATLATPEPLCPDPCNAVAKPIVDSSSTVYVILGLKKIDRSGITREHVIEEKVLLTMKPPRKGDIAIMIFFF